MPKSLSWLAILLTNSCKPRPLAKLSAAIIVLGLQPIGIRPAVSLPSPEDTPEEVLRTEVITEARSPVDGKLLTASEYAELQSELQARPVKPPLNRKLRQNISLLRLRRLIRTVLPFLPI